MGWMADHYAYDRAMPGPSGAEFDPTMIEIIDDSAAVEPVTDDDAIAPRRERNGWWHTSRNVYLIAAALLIVVLLIAYQLGRHQGRPGAAGPTPDLSASPRASQPSGPNRVNVVAETGKQCASQPGPQRLQLGIEIVNQTTQPVTLVSLTPTGTPSGVLRQTAQSAGTCGQLSFSTGVSGYVLAAGASTWITTTFDVLVDCPAPYPVQFNLMVAVAAATSTPTSTTVKLVGFADLGDVSYSSCGSS